MSVSISCFFWSMALCTYTNIAGHPASPSLTEWPSLAVTQLSLHQKHLVFQCHDLLQFIFPQQHWTSTTPAFWNKVPVPFQTMFHLILAAPPRKKLKAAILEICYPTRVAGFSILEFLDPFDSCSHAAPVAGESLWILALQQRMVMEMIGSGQTSGGLYGAMGIILCLNFRKLRANLGIALLLEPRTELGIFGHLPCWKCSPNMESLLLKWPSPRNEKQLSEP